MPVSKSSDFQKLMNIIITALAYWIFFSLPVANSNISQQILWYVITAQV